MTLREGFQQPKQSDDSMSSASVPLTWRQKGIGMVRILFGVAWAVAATLKWQPAFVSGSVDTVGSALKGQSALLQAWIGLWVNIVHINPSLFGYLPALVESLLALCFILGAFTNTAAVVGMLWAFVIWSVPEGFGTPYIAGQSTDIGTGFPYILLCVVLLFVASGRYLGLDRILTAKLGRLGFLAAGSLRQQQK